MAKPIPKSRVNKELELFRASTEARYRISREVFEAQDVQTRDVISRIQDRLMIGANGVIRVYPDGKRQQSVLLNVGLEYIEMNALYVAVEILKDLALMDVRIANFEFPKTVCAECGVKITPPRKRRKR
jgi:hypothetical protein